MSIRAMSEVRDPSTDQSAPVHVEGQPGIHQLVLDSMHEWDDAKEIREVIAKGIEDRRDLGLRKYGTVLQPGNGRDALKDAWDEALDMYVYLTQLKLEGEDVTHELCYAEIILMKLARRFLGRAT